MGLAITSVQYAYITLCILSVVMVSIMIWVGAYISFRPGLPSVSRMMEDHPQSIPYLYTAFAMTTYAVGMLAVIRGRGRWTPNLIVTHLQFLAIVLVPLTSLDFEFVGHMVVAALVVVLTIMRDLVILGDPFVATPVGILHFICLLSIFLLAIVFGVYAMFIPDAENATGIAIVEYTLVKMTAAINIFYWPTIY